MSRDRHDLPGAWPDSSGTRFTVRSTHATAVRLCLYDDVRGYRATEELELRRVDETTWSLDAPGVHAGQLYAYRVEGPFEPQHGHRFNPSKLLIDPWAHAVTGEVELDDSTLGYRPGGAHYDSADSAAAMPRAVVVDHDAFDWQGDEHPRTPWSDTVIYECHVKGTTMRHPDVPPGERGRYLGLGSDVLIEHLQRLGVTAVELLPILHFTSERFLLAQGKRNYWGYNPLAWMAPFSGYASSGHGAQVDECKEMIRRLHAAGIEVILDVVFNHSADGNHLGPTLGLRGFDHANAYRLLRDRRWLIDYTGCGNTLDIRSPLVLDLVLQTVRFWIETMHVDGFRLDLAPTVGRAPDIDFNPDAPFFRAILEDPVLSQAKWIAEPWDLGPGGYRLGGFPAPFAEWNDRFRDTARRVWRGDRGTLGHLATGLAGNRPLYDSRGPLASIHHITCHDGFTLTDLVSYTERRNWSNGEDNRDGHHNNLSSNWGVEGPTTDPDIRATRARARRNLLATLFLARGVPMLLAGDEIGHTQHGNNNVYCQDNDTAWLDWLTADPELIDWIAALTALRRRHPALGSKDWDDAQIEWRTPDGRPPEPGEWAQLRSVAMLLRAAPSEPATKHNDDAILLLINPSPERVYFRLPAHPRRWRWRLDSATGETRSRLARGRRKIVEPMSIVVLEARR